MGHLSSLQSSSSRKGITLESNPELPQFPGFTKSAQHCNLSLFCHIAFLKSISHEVSSDSLHSLDSLYVPAESSPEHRGPTEDIIHYFTLMSSELHYLDIILKIENLTLMSSASGKFDINVLSIWENHLSNTHIFVILPVLFLFSHVLNASEQLQLLIYALLSLKCRELHLRVF